MLGDAAFLRWRRRRCVGRKEILWLGPKGYGEGVQTLELKLRRWGFPLGVAEGVGGSAGKSKSLGRTPMWNQEKSMW